MLLAHPPSRIRLAPIPVPAGGRLQVMLAFHQDAWAAGGDGVTYRIRAEWGDGSELLLERYLDPKRHREQRRWVRQEIDLASLSGRAISLTLETDPGPAGDATSDWAGWAELVVTGAPQRLPVLLCGTGAGYGSTQDLLQARLPSGGSLTLRVLGPREETAAGPIRLTFEPLR